VLTVIVAAGPPALTSAKGGPCSPSTPQYCPPPKVKAGPAEHVTSTSAKLTGTVNPNGSATECRFEYGHTQSYGSTTPPQKVGSGTHSEKVSATITGLERGATYHYQLSCRNLGGLGRGGDRRFQTQNQVKFLGSRTLLVSRRGEFTVLLHCNGNHTCLGTVTLSGSGGRGLAKPVGYTVRPHTTARIRMGLTSSAQRRIGKRHHLAGQLRARGLDGSSASRRVQLRERRRHHS
jgi:hypothetical protein